MLIFKDNYIFYGNPLVCVKYVLEVSGRMQAKTFSIVKVTVGGDEGQQRREPYCPVFGA